MGVHWGSAPSSFAEWLHKGHYFLSVIYQITFSSKFWFLQDEISNCVFTKQLFRQETFKLLLASIIRSIACKEKFVISI